MGFINANKTIFKFKKDSDLNGVAFRHDKPPQHSVVSAVQVIKTLGLL